jgi:hypothetical protein
MQPGSKTEAPDKQLPTQQTIQYDVAKENSQDEIANESAETKQRAGQQYNRAQLKNPHWVFQLLQEEISP